MNIVRHRPPLFAALCFTTLLCAEDPAPLTLKSTIALPGVEGRFDHAAMDVATHRLFFAALGNNTLEVVDIAAGKRLHTITGLKKPLRYEIPATHERKVARGTGR